MTRKKKGQPKGFRLSKNKRYYGFFSFIAVALLIISSTFAWVSWYEWKQNHLQGDPKVLTPKVAVQGRLEAQTLTHQDTITRNLAVKNTGKVPVFIRVALAEELVTFEVDLLDKTGNGHLKEYSSLPVKGTELQADVLSTWQVGNYFKRSPQGTYLKSLARESYEYRQGDRGRPAQLKPIQLTFGLVDPPSSVKTAYWLYEEVAGKGYYYYSDIVPVGSQTTVLITTTELTDKAPNGLKGGLHQLNVQATGGEALSGIYAEWGIPEVTGNKLYDRYHELLTK